jgi:UDP-arabinose 4-epimerase
VPLPRILVIGGAGYIGSYACKTLAVRGCEPVIYDNLSCGNRWAVNWGPLDEGEIPGGARLRAVLDCYQPVCAMFGESVEQPLLYYQKNVGGSGSASLFHEIIETPWSAS